MAESEIDVDALMAKIRVEVARRRCGTTTVATTEAQTAPLVRASVEPVTVTPAAAQLRAALDQAQGVAKIGTTVPPFVIFGPIRRCLARFVTRLLYYVLQVITVDQRVFNGLLLNALRNVGDWLQQSQSDLANCFSQLESAVAERNQRLATLEAEIAVLAERDQDFATALKEQAGHQRTTLIAQEQRLAQVEAALTHSAGVVSNLKTSLILQEDRLGKLLEEARKRLPEPFDQSQLQILAEEERHLLDAMYFSLGNQFRGTRDDIKNRLRVYLPLVREANAGTADRPITDLGCGRGEWLELLKEDGLMARGVEVNRILLQQCRSRGLEVVTDNALAHLQSLPDNSLGAVTAFHLLEHLSHDVLIALLTETTRVLKPGGVAVFETPNPQNVLVGSCTFYLDPTHHHPLPSALVKFLAEARGLCRVKIIPLHPYDERLRVNGSDVAERFNEYFYGPQDYGVIAWKP